MSKWAIMAPYARLSFRAYDRAKYRDFLESLEKLPGAKLRGGAWNVPENALSTVAALAYQFEVEVASSSWGTEPPKPVDWEHVRLVLSGEGELKERDEKSGKHVLDEFLAQYQKDAITFGWPLSGVHVWHPTGAGKTLTAILLMLSVPGPGVIVTRAAARLQLGREVERFTNLRTYVMRPDSQKGLIRVLGLTWNDFRSKYKGQGFSMQELGEMWQAFQDRHGIDGRQTLEQYLEWCEENSLRPVVVVGWEALVEYLSVLRSLRPGAVIFDESHFGKSTKRWDVAHLAELSLDVKEAAVQMADYEDEARKKSGFIKKTDDGLKMFTPHMNRAAAAAELGRFAQKRVATTATPIKDRVRDLWGQLDCVEPNAWGNSSQWRTRYADMKPGVYGGMDDRGSSNLDELKSRLSGIAHVLPYERTHGHLPAKRRQSVYIAPEDQVQPMGGFKEEIRKAKARGPSAMLEVRLAQAASRKRQAVLGLIEDHVGSSQKVCVFTARRRDCEKLGTIVRGHGPIKKKGVKVWVAHGEQSTELRQNIVDEYMAHPGPCVLVGTGHAFGESLNIDTTDAALFVMLPYTPGQLRQWEGRFHRASTVKPVIIYYVIAENTVDEHVASILIDKLPAVEDVVQDAELAASRDVLAGFDDNESDEDFIQAILDSIED